MLVVDLCPFRQSLSEGLIQVPPSLLRLVLDIIAETMFWMLRDKLPAMKTQYPQHYAAVLAEAKRWGVTLPRAKFRPPDDKLSIVHRRLDLSDMGPPYRKLQADRNNLLVVLDYGRLPGDGVAYFKDRTRDDGTKDAVIAVRMLRIRGVAEFPARRTPEEVPYIMAHLKSVIRHELQHLIQHVLLAPKDRRQIATLPDYRAHGTDYFASQVERDPQIADAVDEFIEFWQHLHQPGVRGVPSLAKAVKQFIGAIPQATLNGFQINATFKALRKVDPVGYRRAVRKFLPALSVALADLTHGSPAGPS